MYSFGKPSFRPLISPVKRGGIIAAPAAARWWNRADQAPLMTPSNVAASRTSLVNGPIWSSDEANATRP